jgi:hypothetical protein
LDFGFSILDSGTRDWRTRTILKIWENLRNHRIVRFLIRDNPWMNSCLAFIGAADVLKFFS